VKSYDREKERNREREREREINVKSGKREKERDIVAALGNIELATANWTVLNFYIPEVTVRHCSS
jgi:hypothetical protein